MLSIEQLSKLDPAGTQNLTDSELEAALSALYDFAEVFFDDWLEEKISSKNPTRLLINEENNSTL